MSDLFGGGEMMALSWKQPFASAMLVGKIETRTWYTNYRGLVLICASKQSYNEAAVAKICGVGETVKGLYFSMVMQLKGNQRAFDSLDKEGHAIAVGRLIHCRPMQKEDESQTFVKYRPGLWCHIYDDVKPIEPIPWKGMQGWKKLFPEFISEIKYI